MLNKVGEFAFDARKQKHWEITRRRMQESIFRIKAQAKTRGAQERGESVFDVGIIRGPVAIGPGSPIATGRELSKLDRIDGPKVRKSIRDSTSALGPMQE